MALKKIECKNYYEVSKAASEIVTAQMTEKPDSVLGLATGSTPIGLYKLLVGQYEIGRLDFSDIKTVNLDEYYPMSPEDPESYRYFMNLNLFNRVNIKRENTNVPDGMARVPEDECERYEELIKSLGGIDLQVLGIGRNGHIGFNEPAETLNTLTHITELTESTKQANSRFFENRAMPEKALTMGMGTIFNAKKIIILASGEEKIDAVKKLLDGDVSCSCPASLLNLHPDATLIYDLAAAGKANTGKMGAVSGV